MPMIAVLLLLALIVGLVLAAVSLGKEVKYQSDHPVPDEHEQVSREFHGMLDRIRQVVTQRKREENAPRARASTES